MTIGLCMIVRDEATVIERCLASMRPLIDTWTIIDTGSTDGTQALIEAALNGVPGRLLEQPWVDFGANRTALNAEARGSAGWLLLADADMTAMGDGPPPSGAEDAWSIPVEDGSLRYRLPALIRGDLEWIFRGRTHEYVDLQSDQPNVGTWDGIRLIHHADGGGRAQKFQRDLDLLAEPVSAREWFYRAQSLEHLGRDAEAIVAYDTRRSLPGFPEERWYASWRAAALTSRTDWHRGVALLLDAWDERPWRAEPLLDLTVGYRIRAQHRLADHFARVGQAITFPEGEALFIHRDVYEWRFTYERSITSWWVGDPDLSRRLGEALLARGDLPGPESAAVRANLALGSSVDSGLGSCRD